MPTRVSELLRFRGELVAAGAVVLATGTVLTLARFDAEWASGVRFVLAAMVAALLLGLAWVAPQDGVAPRVYVSVLLVAGFPLAFLALGELADVLGSDGLANDGTLTWTGALLTAGYATLARLRRSAICTLLAGAAGVVTLIAFVSWAFSPDGVSTYRWVLLLAIIALAAGALRLRDDHRRHAVSLIDAAGLSALGLALLGIVAGLGFFGDSSGGEIADGRSPGTGWELVLLLLGCGLIAYSAVDREPGPGYFGALVLIGFALTAAAGDSLIGWPLILVLLGGGVIAAGLRPSTPAPPSPDAAAPTAPTASFPPPPRPSEPAP